VQTLKRKLPPGTPILGCSGTSIMGMDCSGGEGQGVELAYEKEGPYSVSLLLGHLPNCRAHVFAAADPPFDTKEESSGASGAFCFLSSPAAGPWIGLAIWGCLSIWGLSVNLGLIGIQQGCLLSAACFCSCVWICEAFGADCGPAELSSFSNVFLRLSVDL
jgi:hypothetical protein